MIEIIHKAECNAGLDPAQRACHACRGCPKGNEPYNLMVHNNIPLKDYKKYYGLTVRHNPTYSDSGFRLTDDEKKYLYQRFEKWLRAKPYIKKVHYLRYELKEGRHFHALVEFKKVLLLKNIKRPNYHIEWVPIDKKKGGFSGWRSYCLKEYFQEIRKEQEAIISQYNNSYLFYISPAVAGS